MHVAAILDFHQIEVLGDHYMVLLVSQEFKYYISVPTGTILASFRQFGTHMRIFHFLVAAILNFGLLDNLCNGKVMKTLFQRKEREKCF